eukprot:13745866-Alexandrium_andersonii.AAC.1
MRPEVLVANRAWLIQLRAAHANLSFSQSVVTRAFRTLVKPAWDLSPSECLDWSETMGRRVRAACRHLQQASLKQPRWWQRAFGADLDAVADVPPAA